MVPSVHYIHKHKEGGDLVKLDSLAFMIQLFARFQVQMRKLIIQILSSPSCKQDARRKIIYTLTV